MTKKNQIKFADDSTRESNYAIDDPRTAQFMREFFDLCEKHQMEIVPRIDSLFVNFHDGMIICPFTPEIKKLIETRTGVPI